MLTLIELSKHVDYNPDSGVVTWRIRERAMFTSDVICQTWNSRFSKKIAGAVNAHGYVSITFCKKKIKAHQLAFFISHGFVPALIDHINGDRSDNRLSNLRAASVSDNNANKAIGRLNKSGVKGVSWHKKAKKWQVHVRKLRVSHYAGLFSDLNLAKEARKQLADKLHGEFAFDGVRDAT